MRRAVIRAVSWTLLDSLGKNLLLFAFTVVLARLLTPADFGVVAMLSLFTGIASALAEGGLGSALVQTQEPSKEEVSTVFWAQALLGSMLGLALAVSGPLLANWFSQPLIAALAIAYGVNIFISALGSIHTTLFMKRLQFRTPTLIAFAAQIVAGGAAVFAAVVHAGAWAIIVQAITASALTTTLLWVFSPWRPSLVFSMAALRKFAGSGAYTVGTGVLAEVELRIGSIAVGRFSGPVDTGLFQRASSLQLFLSRLLSGVVTRVAFPAFAAVQNEPKRLGNAIREAAFVNFAATAMIMWTVAIIAEPLIRLVFGPAWNPSAPVLRALCLAAGFYPVYAVFAKALKATGQFRVVFIQQAIRAAGMTAAAFAFAASGFVAVAWAQSIFLIASLAIGSTAIARSASYPLRSQLADLSPIAFAGATMGAAGLALVIRMKDAPDLTRVLAVGATCVITYIATLAVLTAILRMEAARLAWCTLSSFFRGPSHGKV